MHTYFHNILKVFFEKKTIIIFSLIIFNILFALTHQFTIPAKSKFASTFIISDIFINTLEAENLLKSFYTKTINRHKQEGHDYFNISIRSGENIFPDYSSDTVVEGPTVKDIQNHKLVTIYYESLTKRNNKDFLKYIYSDFDDIFKNSTLYKIRNLDYRTKDDISVNFDIPLEFSYNQNLSDTLIKTIKNYFYRLYIINKGYKTYGVKFLINLNADEYFISQVISLYFVIIIHLIISFNLVIIFIFYYLNKRF